jgi:Outer membrane protein beta-barrel domain
MARKGGARGGMASEPPHRWTLLIRERCECMRRNNCLVCLAAGVAVVGLSATTAQAQLRVGIVGGVNLASMSSDAPLGAVDLKESDFLRTRPRFGVGGVLEYSLADGIALVAQPQYLGKGAKVDGLRSVSIGGGTVGVEADGHVGCPYLELPLLVKIGLRGAGVRPYVVAGPSLGVRLGNLKAAYTVRGTMGGQTLFEEPVAESSSENVSRIDVGVSVGAGVAVPLRRSAAFIEAHYVHGLSDIDTTAAARAKNSGVQLRVGVTFPIGR